MVVQVVLLVLLEVAKVVSGKESLAVTTVFEVDLGGESARECGWELVGAVEKVSGEGRALVIPVVERGRSQMEIVLGGCLAGMVCVDCEGAARRGERALRNRIRGTQPVG